MLLELILIPVVSLICVLLLLLFTNVLHHKPDGSDVFRTLFEVIESRGFRAEAHEVTTSDGYILTLHRIVNPLHGKGAPLKPVLLQHGFCGNSSSWIVNTDDGYLIEGNTDNNLNEIKSRKMGNNLALELANIGYDVWVGNFRGNVYSRGHTRLEPMKDLQEYWAFSMDELIKYDLPSSIDYILNATKNKTLAYVGMSMGNSTMFGLLATGSKYNEIIKPFIAMAPCPMTKVPIIGKLEEINKTPSLFIKCYCMYLASGGPYRGPWAEWMAKRLLTGHIFQKFTELSVMKQIKNLVGFDDNQVMWERISVFFSHQRENFAKRCLHHFYQCGLRGSLRRFDFGAKGNIREYGEEIPPRYELENISNKYMALVYSKNDKCGPLKTLRHFKEALKVPLFEDYDVPLDNFGHMDVQYGRDAGRYVYPKVVDILEKATQ